jgi:hypothetical protein
MSLVLHYNIVLKKSESRCLELPDLKASCLLLKSFEIKSEQKAFEIKLMGKDTIVSYGEAVFYQTNQFDLNDKMSQIISADKIHVSIRNLCTAKDMTNVAVSLTFNYSKLSEGNIIFNNVYTNLNAEGLSTILSDLSKAGKHITKVIWTSPNKLTSLELIPQFETEPNWLSPIKEVANQKNQIVMDLTGDRYDPDLVNQLCYYNLVVPETLEKLGVIVYGFAN